MLSPIPYFTNVILGLREWLFSNSIRVGGRSRRRRRRWSCFLRDLLRDFLCLFCYGFFRDLCRDSCRLGCRWLGFRRRKLLSELFIWQLVNNFASLSIYSDARNPRTSIRLRFYFGFDFRVPMPIVSAIQECSNSLHHRTSWCCWVRSSSRLLFLILGIRLPGSTSCEILVVFVLRIFVDPPRSWGRNPVNQSGKIGSSCLDWSGRGGLYQLQSISISRIGASDITRVCHQSRW